MRPRPRCPPCLPARSRQSHASLVSRPARLHSYAPLACVPTSRALRLARRQSHASDTAPLGAAASPRRKNFAFKCHRHNEQVFAINSIAFHPFGTFATCGSDGGQSVRRVWLLTAPKTVACHPFAHMPSLVLLLICIVCFAR